MIKNSHIKKTKVKWNIALAVFSISLFISACSGSLPKSEDKTKSPWRTFDEAYTAYEKIIINESTTEDLRKLGFDPYITANVRILSYLDVLVKFMPTNSVQMDQLPISVQKCLAKQKACKAYEAHPGTIKRKRVGNAFLDLLSFKRQTIETGWRFNALIVLDDDVAIYKVWSGIPMVDSERFRRNPLGPLQGSAGGSLMEEAIGL